MSFTRPTLLPGFEEHERIKSAKSVADSKEETQSFLNFLSDAVSEVQSFADTVPKNDFTGLNISSAKVTASLIKIISNFDFSHSDFLFCSFEGVTLRNCKSTFSVYYHTKFINCRFSGVIFEVGIFQYCLFDNCIFEEHTGFYNGSFADTKLFNCFSYAAPFNDCKFDVNTVISTSKKFETALGFRATCPRERRGLAGEVMDCLERKNIYAIARSIKEAYKDGGVKELAIRYEFVQKQAFTRYNSKHRTSLLLWEIASGHGLRPMRCLSLVSLLFMAASAWFSYRLHNLESGTFLSAGAIFTFGAKTELLDQLGYVDHVIYILAAFMGVCSVALFMTVLAFVLLRDV